jgi:hypothetical protein
MADQTIHPTDESGEQKVPASSTQPLPSADAVAEAFAQFQHTPHPKKEKAPAPIPHTPLVQKENPEIPLPPPDVPKPAETPLPAPAPEIPTPAPAPEIPVPEPQPEMPPVSPAPLPAPVSPTAAKQVTPPVVRPTPAPQNALPADSLTAQALAAKLPDKLPAKAPVAPMQKLTEDIPLGTHTQAPPLRKDQAEAPPAAQPPQQKFPRAAEPSIVEKIKAQGQSPLHPLRTLRLDVEESVKEHKTSLVTVAAAEENRRAKGAPTAPSLTEEKERPARSYKTIIVALSAGLVLAGAGALFFVFMPRTVPVATLQLPASTLIFIDDIQQVPLGSQDRSEVMGALVASRESTHLSLGLISELYPTATATTSSEAHRASVRDILRILAPSMQEELVRVFDPQYVLGVHVFDGNQAFLLLKTSSYEQAYSGMVAWEPSMRADLLPLFDRRPRPRAPQEKLSTSTAPAVIKTGFQDAVVENHDARVFKDAEGNIVLLWTFVDRSSLVITTNERTLQEIVSRLRNAPIQGL